MRTLY